MLTKDKVSTSKISCHTKNLYIRKNYCSSQELLFMWVYSYHFLLY